MKTFIHYLVKREYDELNKRVSGSRLRSDGPIRANSIGRYCINTSVRIRGMLRKDYYLMYITEGRIAYELDGVRTVLEAGDFILYPPLYPIYYTHQEGEDLVFYLIHFSGTDADRLVSALNLPTLPAVCTVGVIDGVCREFDRLFEYCTRGTDMLQDIVATGVQSILLSLAERAGKPPLTSAPRASIMYINRNFSEKIRVSELARLENLSESRFYTVFKRATGKSPVDYIIDKRIEMACTLLSTVNLSIEAVGQTVGFSDAQFFSKQFKSRMGMSPLQYRKSLYGG